MSSCPLPWLLVALSACCNCIGSLLLKQSRLGGEDSGFWGASSPWLLAALGVYSTGLLLFAQALDRLPFQRRFPFLLELGSF